MKNRRIGIIEKINNISSDLKSNTVVEIHYGTVAYVCGCNKITVYTDENIKMDCKDTKISFEGKCLSLENLINGQLSVCGKISKVEFYND